MLEVGRDRLNELQAQAVPVAQGVQRSVRVLYVTDLHLWHKNPANRVAGSYADDMLRKAHQVYTFAKENEVDLVIWGGDLTHRPQVPPQITNAFLAMTLNYTQQGGRALFAVGEHDTEGRQPDRYTEGFLGTLAVVGGATGAINIGHDPTKPYGVCLVLYRWEDCQLSVALIPAPPTLEDVAPSLAILKELGEFQLLVLHHPISSEDPPWPHIDPKDLPVQPHQVVLCGHIHRTPEGLPRNVLMPGAAARRDYTEADREPYFILLEINQDPRLNTARAIPFEARSSEGLFLQPDEGDRKSVKTAIEEARNAVMGAASSTKLSLRELVDARLGGSEQGVRDLALKCFEEAQG